MSKVYSKSISVTRGIPKPKTTTNTNLTRDVTESNSDPVDATKVAGKSRTKTRRGCGCGRKK